MFSFANLLLMKKESIMSEKYSFPQALRIGILNLPNLVGLEGYFEGKNG